MDNNCANEVRVGMILPNTPTVYEDQLPSLAFVYVQGDGGDKLVKLQLHAFEMTDADNNVWEVTYLGCWDA